MVLLLTLSLLPPQLTAANTDADAGANADADVPDANAPGGGGGGAEPDGCIDHGDYVAHKHISDPPSTTAPDDSAT